VEDWNSKLLDFMGAEGVKCTPVQAHGQTLPFYHKNINEVIKRMFADPVFKGHISYGPNIQRYVIAHFCKYVLVSADKY
jgi:hypothetical protein